MIPDEHGLLRDAILATGRSCGVPLEEHRFVRVSGLYVLHVRVGGKPMRGCSVRLPAGRRSPGPDVLVVHGSGHRSSRMWPRRRDGTFDVRAVTRHLLALVDHELSRPPPALDVPAGVPPSASGLHVVHLGAVRLGVVAPGSSAESLLSRAASPSARERIEAELRRRGLSDASMRALGDAAGLFVGRSLRIDDHDPLEPPSDRHLTILRLGRALPIGVERRYALLVERVGAEVEVADPAGEGLVVTSVRELRDAWRLGATRGKLWIAVASRSWRTLPNGSDAYGDGGAP